MKTILAVVVMMLTYLSIHAFAQKMCNSGSECSDTECCVSNYPPRGKRFLNSHLGHCVPMGTLGSSCLVRYNSLMTKPADVVYACPCSTGLHCHGSGLIEVPLGERGQCA